VALVELADIASCVAIWESNAIFDSSGNDAYFVLADEEVAEFGVDVEGPGLWYDEVLAVRGEEDGIWGH